jgi:hypothetical protein
MPEYTIQQLPSAKHTVSMAASTKNVWRGPATILTITLEDGYVHQVEFGYYPDATVKELLEVRQRGE